ncbi:MAG: hypothetical protein JWL69_4920, partial [Phycisphaerales bacterium]|nr:hypothetical protein [Phycisphaerales bacterium]
MPQNLFDEIETQDMAKQRKT